MKIAFAGPSRTTYQAKIVKPDGYPLEATSVNFKFTILDPSGSCILYSETYSSVNMGSSAGLVSFSLGSGVRTFPVSGSTFEQVFSNTTASLTCDAGGPGTYSPLATDTRKIVMQFNDSSGWQTLPAMTINAVPYAMYANDSLKFSGKDITDFVQVASLPSCGASEAVRFNGVGFSCVAVGGAVTSGSVITALGYTPADGASITTVTSTVNSVSSTVASVSSTVYSVSSTVTSLQNSVAASFAAITSSQWTTSGSTLYYLSGNVGVGTATPVTKLDVSGGVRISMESAACTASFAGTLRYNSGNVEYCNGSTWSAFGISGAGLQSLNGSTSGTQTFAMGTAGILPAFNTVNGIHTLNIPLASAGSVTAGLISNTDYQNFSNKITSSAASIAQVLGYVPASATALENYLVKSNNLSDVVSAAAARSNLGVGYIGTLSALASSDVTTALGYTPVASGSLVSSQWTTSGSAINYSAGNVGIGTTAPGYKLDVQGGDINASGSVRAAGVALTSDRRWKRNITPLKNSIEKIKQINGVSYDWAIDDYPEKQFSNKRQVGVIAQDVQAVFPELVLTDKEGFLSVNYPALVAPLIEAFKAQQQQIEANVRMFKAMQGEIEEIKLHVANNAREIAQLRARFEAETKALKKENQLLKTKLEKIEKFLEKLK